MAAPTAVRVPMNYDFRIDFLKIKSDYLL